METKEKGAPGTYQEWLECLSDLKTHKVDGYHLQIIGEGTLSCSTDMLRKLEERIADTVSEMANHRINRFVKRMNQLLAFGEVQELPLLFRHFRKEIMECFFFKNISFISKDAKEEIELQLQGQIGSFWKDMIDFLRKAAEEDESCELEDSLFLIGRIILFPERLGAK